ncbi:MAG: DUF2062 domain-containing protein [Thermosynechococcaceae cyanobacterium]
MFETDRARVPASQSYRRACPVERSRQHTMTVRRWWRYYSLRLRRLRGSRESIARGLAVGAFAGMFPIMGFQIIVGVLLAMVLRGNKIAAAAATWISNPFTYLPLFAFNFQVGQWVLMTHHLRVEQLGDVQNFSQLLHLSGDFLITLLAGCSVMGAITAMVAYGGGLWLVKRLRRRRLRHRR